MRQKMVHGKHLMSRPRRIILFVICFVLLLIASLFSTGSFIPSYGPHIVIFTALLMIAFISLFLEYFFTTPSDVLASTIAILLLISPLSQALSKLGILYCIFYSYNVLLLICSLAALLLLNSDSSGDSPRNKVSNYLKQFSTKFGNGKFLFWMLFFLTLVFYIDSNKSEFLILLGLSIFILLVDPINTLVSMGRSNRRHEGDIGEIIGVQSKNVFLARLYTERNPVKPFDVVEFRFKYSLGDEQRIYTGLIIDNFVLDEQQWIKILSNTDIRNALGNRTQNINYKNNVVYQAKAEGQKKYLKSFVGVVLDGSDIGKIRFEYDGRIPIFEGRLVKVNCQEKVILYQVIQGLTAMQNLESKNEAGFIVGEAVQLGEWSTTSIKFEKYGWVPDINSPVLLADDVVPKPTDKGELIIGYVPGTHYPVVANLNDAVTHHMGILGVTGCGKSVFCRNLLKSIVELGTKAICIDFSNEYKNKCSSLSPVPIVPEEKQDEMFRAIDAISAELENFPNKQDKELIKTKSEFLRASFIGLIEDYLKSDDKLALFELPDVSNTTGILEYTKWFFKGLFEVAKKAANSGKQVCVVLEEAHTIVPEWNFLGSDDRKAQSLVNTISQIALQGRKYNIGFIVIAQRTANVSKTILTQCNSIIAFQQFDRTGAEYLANYMGTEMVNAIPNLKFRQAIAVGKAFKSGMPIIFEVPELDEGT